MWFIFALITAFFYALQGTWSKKIMSAVNRRTVTWSIFAFSVPFIIPVFLISGVPEVQSDFYWSCSASLVLNMVAYTMFVKAVKISPLALTYPFLSFTPAFIILTGFLFLGEIPSIQGMIGILSIVLGAYVINFEKIGEGFFSPVKAIFREKGSLLMLGVSLLWSFAATFDKVAVVSSDPYFFILVLNTGFFVLYIPFLMKSNPGIKGELRRHFWELLVLGLFSALIGIFQMTSLQTGYVSYVIAIKRSGMIFAIIFGILLFNEKLSFFRLAGTVFMLTGIFIIAGA